MRGPVMGFWVWMRRDSDSMTKRRLPVATGPLADTALAIVVDDDEPQSPIGLSEGIYCERSYYAALDAILVNSATACHDTLVRFTTACLEHLQTDLSRL